MNNKENFKVNDILIQLDLMDYISMILSYYVTSRGISSYKLHKEFKPKNISKVILPPELKQEYFDIDFKKLASQQFGEAAIEFARLITNKFSQKNLINFYNNINELKIQHKSIDVIANIAGSYNSSNNTIQVDRHNYTSTIWHELFHMASSIYKNDIVYCGFTQVSSGFEIGRGLTEGYTELLTQRYFGHKKGVKSARGIIYPFEVHITKKLEQIIGQEKMESLYLNANLLGLINILKNYTSEDEIMKFVSGVDFLNKHLYDKKMFLIKKEMITRCLINVNEFLLKAYTLKLKKLLDDKAINLQELNQFFNSYLSSLGTNLAINTYNFDFFTYKRIQKNLDNLLPNLNFETKTNER